MQDGTRGQRCLAIGVRLTSPELIGRLWPLVWAGFRLIARFRRGPIEPAHARQFEADLDAVLREIGRIIVEWTFNNLEPDDRPLMPPQVRWEGEYYRRRFKSPVRNLACRFGPIRLLRFCYQPLESTGRCLFPLERQLGIVAGLATPALAEYVARLSADLTQRNVLDQLRLLGIHWGVSTLRRFQSDMAALLEECRHPAQVQQLLTWLLAAAESQGPRCFTLAVGRDGIMLPIVRNQKYKEAGTATVSVLDRCGRRLGTVYLGQMPEAGQKTLSEQLTRLLRDVLSQWSGELPRFVYVTDAGHHPTEYFEQVLQWMRHPRTGQALRWEWIVDYYHACLYVTRLAEALFGKGRAAYAWAAKMRKWLKTKPGGLFRVLRSAGALYSRRGLVGNEDDYWTAYRYLRDRASKMNYASFKRRRLPIGSGVTEAACKIVFTQRFKLSGMKWTLAGGSPILVFRTILLSRVWAAAWNLYLASHTQPQVVTPKPPAEQHADFARKIAA